jgi:hypothetical protein
MRIDKRFEGSRAAVGAAVFVGFAATLLAGGTGNTVPAAGGGGVLASAAGKESAGKDCCFTNPAYSGVCVVRPTGEETCASILAYLNNDQTIGRSYCDRTNIRRGWQQVKCEDEAPTAAETEPR